MITKFSEFYNSSIGKKQIVAITGLILILFVVAHLAGNLFIYGGPSVYNAYAKKLASLRPFLNIVEAGLLLMFLIHMHVTATLVWNNYHARGSNRYVVSKPVGDRSIATVLMPYTGAFILAFVIWHLLDFTFVDQHGARSILPDGQSYGVYGIVYNAFMDPLHSTLYILAMISVGMHLSHGISSFFQTFGYNHPKQTVQIEKISNAIGFFVAATYSSMPVYILINSAKFKLLI